MTCERLRLLNPDRISSTVEAAATFCATDDPPAIWKILMSKYETKKELCEFRVVGTDPDMTYVATKKCLGQEIIDVLENVEESP